MTFCRGLANLMVFGNSIYGVTCGALGVTLAILMISHGGSLRPFYVTSSLFGFTLSFFWVQAWSL